MDDAEQVAEQLVRDSLRARAERVDTTAPLVAAARRTVRRRRGAGAVLVAAAAVVAVVVAGVVVRDPEPRLLPGGPTTADDPSGWRTERWHDLAVDVPADWGYGVAPMRSAGMDVVCGEQPEGGYVGRPVMTTDACMGGNAISDSAAPYVWLGADVEPGERRLGDGTVEETVEVAGTTLTVAGDDALRGRVLDSARTGGTCPSELRRAPTDPLPIGDTGEDLQMCAYRVEDEGGPLRLAAAESLSTNHARSFIRAYEAAPVIVYRCLDQTDHELVLLQAGERQWVVDFTCPGIRRLGGADAALRDLTVATVRPWADGVVSHVLYGPLGGKGATGRFFIGPQG